MPTLLPDKMLALILGLCLLLMASINVYMVLRLLFRIDDRDAAAGDESDAQWLAGIAELCASLDPDGLGEFGETMEQSASLLEDLGSVSGEEFSAWREANRQRIADLLANQRRQHQQLVQMRHSLAQSQATIDALRHRKSRRAASSAQLVALRALVADREKTIRSLTEERTRYQSELQAEKRQQETSRADGVADRQALEAENARLTGEVERLQSVAKDLAERNSELQATHERTVQEKLFIEEAFVKLDKHLSEHAPEIVGAGMPVPTSEETT